MTVSLAVKPETSVFPDPGIVLIASILVVDDDQGICMLLKRWLTAAGCQVELATDGRAAIRSLEARSFDLMLTDIIMPDREGIETLIEVRRRWPQCSVIAMSGGGRIGAEQFLTLADHLGADATIRKPFKREALLELFKQVLEPAADELAGSRR